MSDKILQINDLSILPADGGEPILNDIAFTLEAGEILGIVGESGSGKSTTALAITDLLPANMRFGSGTIRICGTELRGMESDARRRFLTETSSIVYQDALTALNPLMKAGRQTAEVLELAGKADAGIRDAVLETFRLVGLSNVEEVYESYPFELSGGMRQRVLIAMALIGRPRLLIADESTTALDRRLADQILDLLRTANGKFGTSILFISHDLGQVASLCSRILVMRDGEILESGLTKDILSNPAHEYTRTLLEARPTPEKKGEPLPAGNNGPEEAGIGEPLPDLIGNQRVVMKIRDLCAGYDEEDEDHVLDDIDLDIYRGEFLGLLGESGSGKTTIARVLTGQLKPDKGEVIYHGRDLTKLGGRARREASRGLGMIFQDPYSSLDPHMSIFRQIEEPLIIAGERNAQKRREAVYRMLDAVDLDRGLASRKPARLSGGQRQRVAIAIATIREPELLIADEAVASLDVSVQAQILNLLQRLRDRLGFSCLFIAHDLEVIYYLCQRVAILHEGRIVECDRTEEVFHNPKHPYTKDLVSRLQYSFDWRLGE